MEKQIELTKTSIKNLSKTLKAIRTSQGIPQGKVSGKMKVLQSHVSMIENDKIKKIPMLPTLIKYANAVNCRVMLVLPDTKNSA